MKSRVDQCMWGKMSSKIGEVSAKEIELPVEKIVLEGREWAAFLSTGVTENLIHPACAEYFVGRIENVSRKRSIVTTLGQQVKVIGRISNLITSVRECVMRQRFLVARIGHQVILRWDFLKEAGLMPKLTKMLVEDQERTVSVFPRMGEESARVMTGEERGVSTTNEDEEMSDGPLVEYVGMVGCCEVTGEQ
ncbi:hypothetical protein CSUI_010338, partial [Cystoisospora suis]